MRLGFSVKVLGQPGLKSHDTRRWQNTPHLSVSLAYLRDIFIYLDRHDIRMYRLASDLAPYVTHPDMPQFHGQIDECAAELDAVGELAREMGLRLSFHPAQYVVLNAEDEAIAARSAAHVVTRARMLDLMGLGPEAVVVTHVGGVYGDKQAATERFAAAYRRLPEPARRRLALENDEKQFSIKDTHRIHQQTGVRLVYDHLHHLNNPDGLSPMAALRLALATWPDDVVPKIHFSSPRTAMREMTPAGESGRRQTVLRPPRLAQHADFIDPFAFIAFCRDTHHLRPFDVMLEAKAKDVALLRLRKNVARFAPNIVIH